MKSRESDIDDEKHRRLKPVVASVSVENELLREKIARLKNGRPVRSWKAKLWARSVSPSNNQPYRVAQTFVQKPR